MVRERDGGLLAIWSAYGRPGPAKLFRDSPWIGYVLRCVNAPHQVDTPSSSRACVSWRWRLCGRIRSQPCEPALALERSIWVCRSMLSVFARYLFLNTNRETSRVIGDSGAG